MEKETAVFKIIINDLCPIHAEAAISHFSLENLQPVVPSSHVVLIGSTPIGVLSSHAVFNKIHMNDGDIDGALTSMSALRQCSIRCPKAPTHALSMTKKEKYGKTLCDLK
ncbi:Uncharacterized protein Fot_21799 [Forsythia ovata]|uniref:Uncharacterized protein n=1 Tax=Forsythia ovata TaxID=205694 RepID=A0ABD1UVW3_9LAMI